MGMRLDLVAEGRCVFGRRDWVSYFCGCLGFTQGKVDVPGADDPIAASRITKVNGQDESGTEWCCERTVLSGQDLWQGC